MFDGADPAIEYIFYPNVEMKKTRHKVNRSNTEVASRGTVEERRTGYP